MTGELLWPRSAGPGDIAAIEAVPLGERGLPETTYALAARAAALWPNHTAMQVLPSAAEWQKPVRRSFAELLADVHRQANLLHQLGVRRHDAVALMSPNCADLITATLAAQLAGITAPINAGLNEEQIAELLSRAGARVLIAAGPELAPLTWEAAQQLAHEGILDALLVLRPTGATGPPAPLPVIAGVRVGYLADLAATQRAAAFVGPLPRGNDLASFFHTGGTTGAPKLAAHTHSNEVTDPWMLAASQLFAADFVVFAALPLFHVNALVVTLLAPLYKGQQVVWAGPLGYREPALFARFWTIVERYRIATMSAVPTVYATLAQSPIDADISSLQFAIVGASPLPAAVRDGFQAHTGVPLLEGYGLTEATCASARSLPGAPRPGAVGQRLPYQQVKVVRPDQTGRWQTLPVGETGVLAISGPTVFPGYVTGRDESGYLLDGMGKLADGWLDTGDLARLDEDGFIYLTGRAKDLIIRGGHNIDPADIEGVLLAHPQVVAAAAVGRPDVHAGEVPVAYVTLVPGADVSEAELVCWAGERVGERAAAPKAVTVLDAIPVTAIGKPYKLALRADAVRREILDALATFAGIEVDTAIADGSVVAAVTALDGTDTAVLAAVLDQYALRWQLAVRSTDPTPVSG
jgi:fatty-acyl-CoA synthase